VPFSLTIYTFSRKEGILVRRKEAKRRTLQARKEHNRELRGLDK